MSRLHARRHLLRERTGSHARVTFVELFFDLIFVFAVTQLSHYLLAHPTPSGVLQALLLFLAVWWAWIFTTWVTNWLDPERTPVRLLLFVLMLAGLVLSMSIPRAFADRGLAFAGAYVFIQLGRTLFMLWALGDARPGNTRNFQRIAIWLAASGVLWIAGGLSDAWGRHAFWIAALLVEYLAPAMYFRVPGLGRSTTGDWDVAGEHIAERCALFVIIALGESILVTGATFGELDWTRAALLSFTASFVGSVAMWWLYFDSAAERASRAIAASDDPGRLSRDAYTYSHLVIIAGIIVTAACDERVIAHPLGRADDATIIGVLTGPALYLFGNLLFRRSGIHRPALSHLAGLALLATIAPFAQYMPPLLLNAVTTLVLVIVAIWERRSLGRPKEI